MEQLESPDICQPAAGLVSGSVSIHGGSAPFVSAARRDTHVFMTAKEYDLQLNNRGVVPITSLPPTEQASIWKQSIAEQHGTNYCHRKGVRSSLCTYPFGRCQWELSLDGMHAGDQWLSVSLSRLKQIYYRGVDLLRRLS